MVTVVQRGQCRAGQVQLVISYLMLDRLHYVLSRRLSVESYDAQAYVESLEQISRYGPSGEQPHILLGTSAAMATRDPEDDDVLAAAISGEADGLVTANLSDFRSTSSDPADDILPGKAIFRDTPGRASLFIARPDVVVGMLRYGLHPKAESLNVLRILSGK